MNSNKVFNEQQENLIYEPEIIEINELSIKNNMIIKKQIKLKNNFPFLLILSIKTSDLSKVGLSNSESNIKLKAKANYTIEINIKAFNIFKRSKNIKKCSYYVFIKDKNDIVNIKIPIICNFSENQDNDSPKCSSLVLNDISNKMNSNYHKDNDDYINKRDTDNNIYLSQLDNNFSQSYNTCDYLFMNENNFNDYYKDNELKDSNNHNNNYTSNTFIPMKIETFNDLIKIKKEKLKCISNLNEIQNCKNENLNNLKFESFSFDIFSKTDKSLNNLKFLNVENFCLNNSYCKFIQIENNSINNNKEEEKENEIIKQTSQKYSCKIEILKEENLKLRNDLKILHKNFENLKLKHEIVKKRENKKQFMNLEKTSLVNLEILANFYNNNSNSINNSINKTFKNLEIDYFNKITLHIENSFNNYNSIYLKESSSIQCIDPDECTNETIINIKKKFIELQLENFVETKNLFDKTLNILNLFSKSISLYSNTQQEAVKENIVSSKLRSEFDNNSNSIINNIELYYSEENVLNRKIEKLILKFKENINYALLNWKFDERSLVRKISNVLIDTESNNFNKSNHLNKADEVEFLYQEIQNLGILNKEINTLKIENIKLTQEAKFNEKALNNLNFNSEKVNLENTNINKDLNIYKKEILQKEEIIKLKDKTIKKLQEEINELINLESENFDDEENEETRIQTKSLKLDFETENYFKLLSEKENEMLKIKALQHQKHKNNLNENNSRKNFNVNNN